MAIPNDYLKISLTGTISGGGTWSTGFHSRADRGTAWSLTDIQSLTNGLVTPATTWWTAVKAQVTSAMSWTGVKVYVYPSGGGPAYGVASASVTPSAGSLASGGGPLLQSMCVSLLSATAGRSARGRMYLPCTALISSSGYFASAVVDANVNATAALMTAINAQDWTAYSAVSHKCCVVSQKVPAEYDIVTVRADNKPDTQHRREDALNASYTKATAV